MKKKNRIFQNRCTVRGEIVDMERIEGIRGPEDLYLLVETTLPDGNFTDIPCLAAGEKLKDLKSPLKVGDWVTVSGALTVARKEKVSWIEVRLIDRVDNESEREYFNFAAFQGEIQVGTFMFHRGKAVMADFDLGVGDPQEKRRLEVSCLAEGKAMQDYLNCLTCGEVQVCGKMDFTITDDGVIRCFTDVSSISPLQSFCKTARGEKGACQNDS